MGTTDIGSEDRIEMTVPGGAQGIFSGISGFGFLIDAPPGASIREMLKDIIGLDDDYIRDSIGTILYNGKPVDDMDAWKIGKNASIAISAALPGVFGAAFRKQGKYAGLRPVCDQDNSSPGEADPACENEKPSVVLKLFNQSDRDIAPGLLGDGVRMNANSFCAFWENRLRLTGPADIRIGLNGRPVAPEALCRAIKTSSVVVTLRSGDA